jgi:ABC-type dipeptide/oligopeptide/nickel transport system permease subunit
MKYLLPALVLFVVVIVTVFASVLAPYDPMQIHEMILQPPSKAHLLGTDNLGRDLFSRLLYGGQYTLSIAMIATVIALVSGIVFGILWGLSSHWLESVMTVVMSAILALPSFLIALVILTILGKGMLQIALAVGVSQIGLVIQVVRGAIMSVRSAPYIESALAVGATRQRIILYYILPNILPVVIAYGGVVLGYSLLNGSALTFLGLGELGVPDWGVILAEGRAVFDVAPHIAISAGILITSVVFSVNVLVERWVK